MRYFSRVLLLVLILFSCKNENKEPVIIKEKKPKPEYRFGYNVDKYKVIQDTIKSGESFGTILDRHHVYYPKISKIASSIKDIFDVRRVRAGKPYTILASKDSTEKAQVFIYKHSKSIATVVEFNDSLIHSYNYRKPIKTIEKELSPPKIQTKSRYFCQYSR